MFVGSSLNRRSNSLSSSTHWSYLKRNIITNNKSTINKGKRKKKPKPKSKSISKPKPKKQEKSSFNLKVTAPKNNNTSFDFQKSMEDLFEVTTNNEQPNSDEIFVKPEIPGKKKRASSENLELVVQTPKKISKIVLPDEKNLLNAETDVFGDSFVNLDELEKIDGQTPKKILKIDTLPEEKSIQNNESCVFGDSFVNSLNLDELEKIENQQNTVNKSCPKTPKYLVNSEKLELDSNVNCTTQDEIKENTISDSFLERAMATHMSEVETATRPMNASISIAKTISGMHNSSMQYRRNSSQNANFGPVSFLPASTYFYKN